MKKLKKIIYEREWYYTSKPLNLFENRLKDMMNLQVSTITSNIPESSKNEAKKQYLVMLVTCYETYIREIFKILIDEKLVPVSELMKLRKLKEVKFTIDEIEFIRNKDIKLSELVCEYINFQNFGEMMNSFSIIELDKKLDEKIDEKDDIMPLPDSTLLKKSKDGAEIANEFFKQFVTHKKLFNKSQLYKQINLLLKARHKIIHNNIDIAITQEDVYSMTAAVYEFVMLLDRVLQDVRNKKSAPE